MSLDGPHRAARLRGCCSRALLSILVGAVVLLSGFDLAAQDSQRFIRGDANSDGALSLADIMTVVRYLHRPENLPPCADAADVDDSGQIGITDLVGLANFIFSITEHGRVPSAPFPDPGFDDTVDSLDCAVPLGARAPRGGAAALAVAPAGESCTAEDYINDTGPVELASFTPGQAIDFIIFARSCITAFPGQEHIAIPIGLTSAQDLDGFTLSVHALSQQLHLERFSYERSLVGRYEPDLTFESTHQLANGFLASTVFMDFEAPFFGKVFPASPRGVHVADLIVSVSPEAEPGSVLEVRFETTPPAGALRPPIANEFSTAGVSVVPGHKKESGASIRILPSERVFVRGDANRDFDVDISDVVDTLGFLFLARPIACLAPLDANSDTSVSVADPVFLVNYLFLGGPRPARPFPFPGAISGTESCD